MWSSRQPGFQVLPPTGDAFQRCGGRAVAVLLLLLCQPLLVVAAVSNPPAELWLTNAVEYPAAISPGSIQTNGFENMRAEFLAGVVKILWTPPPGCDATRATLQLSADEPGHWPARDWRSYPMSLRGPNWETTVPVDSLDTPLVYFVQTTIAGRRDVTHMRLCRPRVLGLETPTRIFWPFIEGFEEGLESWRWLAGGPQDGGFQISSAVKNGKAALAVAIPPGKASAAIGTTRFRGWHLLEHGATGISLWMRTRQGPGHARFTLFANAFTTNQVAAVSNAEAAVSPLWQKIDLPFSRFPKFPLSEVDFLAIEFLGTTGCEFLIDDLQMMGRWKLD